MIYVKKNMKMGITAIFKQKHTIYDMKEGI